MKSAARSERLRVEDLYDTRCAELRALENLQRRDPHALEEAEEYERILALRDKKGAPEHTPETVAKLAGRSSGAGCRSPPRRDHPARARSVSMV